VKPSQENAHGFLCLVLHAHLPFVRHPEHASFLEEDWLFEAVTECYLPLLQVLEQLVDEGVPVRITLSISPTLASMLQDPCLQERYLRRIERICELAEQEVVRTRWTPGVHDLARRYRDLFQSARSAFDVRYRRDLLSAFRRLERAGALEIITSGATHGFLPLMLGMRSSWRGQIHPAVREHERVFGRPPAGIWLPECGYEEGIEEVLQEAGLRYFFVDAHGILFAEPRPRDGVFSPVRTPFGLAAFGRDLASSRAVWSAVCGYPGDPAYRDFYRDVAWELEYEYLRPYLHGDGRRSNLGIKYYRVTGPGEAKEPYDYDQACRKAREHAEDFLLRRREQIADLRSLMVRPPVVVAPFDAELFGHWWFEGPLWLAELIRAIARGPGDVALATPGEILDRFPLLQSCRPSTSSWGQGGYAETWLNPTNDWIYPHLHAAAERMAEMAGRWPDVATTPALRRRALRQACRELLLAQSSDWAFMMKAGTMVDYAGRRTQEHLLSFHRLYEEILRGDVDEAWLASLEARHNLFPELDYTVYAEPSHSIR
jgi:1,4-alpha-glucan branching enzyme